MARVGLKQLAERLGVDISTVSRALRGDQRVKPETRRVVQRVADELGYRPNMAARALKGGRSGRVAVLLSPPQQRFASPIFLELLSTLSTILHDNALSLTVFAAREPSEELGIVRSLVEDRLADGVVLGRTRQHDERVKYLLDTGFPFVTFGQTSWSHLHSWVEIDYGKAGSLAVESVSVSNPDSLMVVSAHEGLRFADNYVRGALEAVNRLDMPEPQIKRIEMSEAGGEQLAAEALSGATRAAYCCIQDSLAFGFYRAAAMLKSAPGRDFAIFGGQNFPGSEHTAPPLSTFSTQDSYVAELLSKVMLERLNADDTFKPQHHVIDPAPLLRSSHRLSD